MGKNVWYLYKLDWKRIFNNKLATFLIVALMCIPSLYAWFNIKALWDPYGNTGQIPIAVYSDDQGAKVKEQQVEVGKQVLDKLKKNDQLGWKFVGSKNEVTKGVKSGKYYAGIYVPKTFSQDLVSITTGQIKKPQIQYYFNEKINAIAPKITDKGAKNIQEQVKDNFISTASTALFQTLKNVGYDVDANMIAINKVKNMILKTDENFDSIDAKLNEVVALHHKLPELKQKLTKANEAAAYLPKVDEMGQRVIQLNDKMPEIIKQGAIIFDLQKKIPDIQATGEQLSTIHSEFPRIEQTMTDGIEEAKQGLLTIEKVQVILPEVKEMGNQSAERVSQMKIVVEQLKLALPSVQTSVATILQTMDDSATRVQKITTELLSLLEGNYAQESVGRMILEIKNQLNEQAELLTAVENLLTNIEKVTNDPAFEPLIKQLRENTVVNRRLMDQLGNITGDSDKEVEQLKQLLTQTNQAAGTLRQLIGVLKKQELSSKVSDTLNKFLTTLLTTENLLSKINDGTLDRLLFATQETVKKSLLFLEKYQRQLPKINQEIAKSDQLLNGHMNQIIDGINQGARFYQEELPVVSAKLAKAADYMKNSWPSDRTELLNTLTTVNTKLPDVEQALAFSTDLILNDWSSIKEGIHKAAEAIHKSEETVNFEEIIKLMKRDVQKESDFFTNPVDLQTTTMYPIPNNGSASTPFYTALCLWVGALLFSSVATTAYFLTIEERKMYTQRETYLARMLTFLTVGAGQALIVTLGNIFLLGVYVQAPILSLFFTLLVGLTFMMIVYTLVGLFGTIGKGIAIILLVLSISGGGGNYPIQVSGPFFRWINPLLPFTHAVNLLRESSGGVYWLNAWHYMIILLGLFLVFGLLGLIGYPYFLPYQEKTSSLAKESRIF